MLFAISSNKPPRFLGLVTRIEDRPLASKSIYVFRIYFSSRKDTLLEDYVPWFGHTDPAFKLVWPE